MIFEYSRGSESSDDCGHDNEDSSPKTLKLIDSQLP